MGIILGGKYFWYIFLTILSPSSPFVHPDTQNFSNVFFCNNMFDRHGNALSYPTEEAMLNILRSGQLDLENMRSIFKQAMMVDAASHGWNDAIDVMMDLGFSADDTDHKNYTPLGYAAMKGQTTTVKKLLNEYDADPTTRNNFGPSMFDVDEWFEGYTALELALEHEHYATAFVLNDPESWGGNYYVDVWTDRVYELLELEKEAVMALASDDFGETVFTIDLRILVLAVEHGQYASVKQILLQTDPFAETALEFLDDDARARAAFRITQHELDVALNDDAEPFVGPSMCLFQRGLMQLIKERTARNWLKARKAVIKRWTAEYWRDMTARSQFERDRQVEVQAMAELMPPSLPPSPPGSEGDAADLTETAVIAQEAAEGLSMLPPKPALVQLTLDGTRLEESPSIEQRDGGHTRLAELEELLSHDKYEPIPGRVLLWKEVAAILVANPTLHTTLQVPRGVDEGTLMEPGEVSIAEIHDLYRQQVDETHAAITRHQHQESLDRFLRMYDALHYRTDDEMNPFWIALRSRGIDKFTFKAVFDSYQHSSLHDSLDIGSTLQLSLQVCNYGAAATIVESTYDDNYCDTCPRIVQQQFEMNDEMEPSDIPEFLRELQEQRDERIAIAKRNWLKARNAVKTRWLVEYWRDCTARSQFERDRQVEVQAMAELMPPSLPPSPPESEAGDDVAVNSSGSVSGDEFGDDPDPEDYSDDPSESGSQSHSDASINLGEEINEMVTQQMHAADDAIVDREHHQPLSRLIAMYYAVMGVQEGFIAITDDNVDMALGPFWEAFRHRGVSKAQLMDAISNLRDRPDLSDTLVLSLEAQNYVAAAMIVDVTYCEDFWDMMDEALIDHFEPIAHLLPHGFDDLTEIELGDWARLLLLINAKRNWYKAREAVRTRWLVEYWRDCAARSQFERDRQVEVQAMAELMPPSLPS